MQVYSRAMTTLTTGIEKKSIGVELWQCWSMQNREIEGSQKWFNVLYTISSIQSLSCVQLFVTPWIITACQASLFITNSRSSLKPMSIKSVMLSHPLSSPSPSAANPSQHQGLCQWVSSSHEVAKVLEFQLQHQSFQMNTQDWFL